MRSSARVLLSGLALLTVACTHQKCDTSWIGAEAGTEVLGFNSVNVFNCTGDVALSVYRQPSGADPDEWDTIGDVHNVGPNQKCPEDAQPLFVDIGTGGWTIVAVEWTVDDTKCDHTPNDLDCDKQPFFVQGNDNGPVHKITVTNP